MQINIQSDLNKVNVFLSYPEPSYRIITLVIFTNIKKQNYFKTYFENTPKLLKNFKPFSKYRTFFE